MIIYKAINQVNGKIYIGQTVSTLKDRVSQHIYDSKRKNYHFVNALQKHGADNFFWIVINECYDIDTLNQLEEYYIKYYESTNRKIGYNCSTGGDNYTRTKETRARMSIAKTNPSKETRKKHSDTLKRLGTKPPSQKGFKHNPETISKMSGENNHNYGKKWTPEQIEKREKTKLRNLANKREQELTFS